MATDGEIEAAVHALLKVYPHESADDDNGGCPICRYGAWWPPHDNDDMGDLSKAVIVVLKAAEKVRLREPLLSELTIAELQHRIGELEGVLHFKVCGDPRKRVGVATE